MISDYLALIIGTFTGVLFVFVSIAINVRRRIDQRTSQLRHAAYLLKVHYEALEKFSSDAAAPRELKDAALWLSDASSDRDAALELVDFITDDQPVDLTAAVSIIQEVEALRKHRPDLVSLFDQAIRCGLAATFLRWEETAELYTRMSIKSAIIPNGEFVLAARAAQYEQAHPKSAALQDLVVA